MQQYKSEAEWDVTRWERNYSQLSEQHKYALFSEHYTATDTAWIAIRRRRSCLYHSLSAQFVAMPLNIACGLALDTKSAAACTGRCCHISQPSLQRLATVSTTTTSSSRACWQCIKTHKTPHHICLRPTQLQQSMQRGTDRLPQVIWRKSGQHTVVFLARATCKVRSGAGRATQQSKGGEVCAAVDPYQRAVWTLACVAYCTDRRAYRQAWQQTCRAVCITHTHHSCQHAMQTSWNK